VIRPGSIRAVARRLPCRWAGPAVLGIAASLALAACGGSSDNSSTDTSEANTQATAPAGGGGGGETVDVSETEFKLNPSDPTVKAGTVTFNVKNDGSITHSLEVEGPSGDQELEQDLQAGQSGQLSVDLSKPGTYEFYCPIDGHKDQGMKGEITVTS
jgi:uncharacterized cupredoxin-like copper-binding protein